MKEKLTKLTPRQRKAMRTKERLYKTAVKMLEKYDYSSLTVRNICDEAGVSTGTFYHYFESKDDLWFYYLDGGLEEYAKEIDFVYQGDIIEYIVNVYEVYLAYCQEAGIDFLSNYYSAGNKQLARGEAMNRPVARWINEGIAQAKESGNFNCQVSEEELERDVCIIIKGCIFEWCVSDGSFDLIDCAKDVLRRYMNGVFHNKV